MPTHVQPEVESATVSGLESAQGGGGYKCVVHPTLTIEPRAIATPLQAAVDPHDYRLGSVEAQ